MYAMQIFWTYFNSQQQSSHLTLEILIQCLTIKAKLIVVEYGCKYDLKYYKMMMNGSIECKLKFIQNAAGKVIHEM